MNIYKFGLPSEDIIKRSCSRHYDSFYNLPKIIECFIDRANQELPKNYCVKPWTINLAVTVFKDNIPMLIIEYDSIEQDIVSCLDILNKKVKEWEHTIEQ